MKFFQTPINKLQPTADQPKQVIKNRFINSWISFVTNEFGDDRAIANKYILRQQFLSHPNMLETTKIKYNRKSANDQKIQMFERCVRLKRCTQYHIFDISDIYELILTGDIYCKYCKKSTQFLQNQIVPDYISYLFFAVAAETSIDVQFNRKPIELGFPQDQKTLIIQSQNQTIISKKKNDEYYEQIVTLTFNNHSSSFKKILEDISNWELKQALQCIRQENNIKLLRQSRLMNGAQAFSNLQNVSISIVSLITGKRIRSGVLHQDCRHLAKNIYIFDFEGLLLSLYKHINNKNVVEAKKSVKCIYCPSEFTHQNLFQKAMFYNKVTNIISIEPYSSGKIYYGMTLLTNNQISVLKVKQRLITIIRSKAKNQQEFNKKRELYTKIVLQKAVNFWNSQDPKVSSKRIAISRKKAKQDFPMFFKKTIDYTKIMYPVRCKSCNTLDFVDLWDELIHFAQLQDIEFSEAQLGCLVCNQQYKIDESQLQKFIYLDLQVYILMQYKLLNIIYCMQKQRWLPDIQNISFRKGVDTDPIEFIINYLERNLKNYDMTYFSYYQNNFILKKNKYITETQCFVLQKCIQTNKGPDLVSHIIFIIKGKGNKNKFKCPKCQKQAETILDLVYDQQLSSNIKQGYTQWNAETRMFRHTKNKINVIYPQDEFGHIKRMFAEYYQQLPEKIEKKPILKAWDQNQVTNSGGNMLFNTVLVHPINFDLDSEF